MSKGVALGRQALLVAAILAPVVAVVIYACARWGQLALEAVQVALKMVVIP